MRRALLQSLFGLLLVGCTSDQGVSDSRFPPNGRPGGNDAGAVLGDGGATDAGSLGDATTGALTAQSACADLAAARCKRDDACTGGLRSRAMYGDESTCEARTAALCLLKLTAPSNAETASLVESCASSIPMQSCADSFDSVPTQSCLTPAGSLTTGAACVTSSQCTSAYCALGPNAVCGSCATAPKAGDHCASSDECGDRGGLTCAGGICIPIGQANAGCSASIPCGFGLTCVGATAAMAGTCQAAPADAGAACDPTGATAPSCDALLGLRCDPAAKQCVPVLFAAAGQPCGELDGGVTQCAAGECVIAVADAGPIVDAAADAADGAADAALDAGTDAATAPTPAKTGTCVAAAKEGSPCDTARGPSCLPPAKCVLADSGAAGTCMLPNGTTCR